MAKEPKSYNKVALAEDLAIAQNMTKARAGRVIEKLFGIIEDTVANGGEVSIAGFGVFRARTTAAHTARNPRTGEAVDVPERDHPTFKAGLAFKRLVRGEDVAEEDELEEDEETTEPESAPETPTENDVKDNDDAEAATEDAKPESEADDATNDGQPNLFD